MSGLVHIYSGDGKGKTTAAVGLAIRAAGDGKKVVFAQFLKDGTSSEINVLKNIENIDLCVCTKPYGFVCNMNNDELINAKCDFSELLKTALTIASDKADVLVLDEVISSCNCHIVSEDIVYNYLCNRPKKLEVILTGRDPSKRLLSLADYVTEMKKIKHPYDNGIDARKGIEY